MIKLRSDLGGVHTLEQALEQLRFPVQVLVGRPELANPTLADLEEIRARIEAIQARLSRPSSKYYLAAKEALQSLVYAAVAFSRQRIGARLTAADLKELVVAHCAPQHRPHWQSMEPERIYGVYWHEGWERTVANGVREVSELRRHLEAEGIEFWCEELDRCFRFVDSRWLEPAHADMFRWVVGPWGGGRRCRFCAMTESPAVDALLPIELERRHGRTMIGDTVVLAAGASALTHERCRPHWLRLLTTIAPYNSLGEAKAADRAAGRKSRSDQGVQTSALPLEAPK